MKKPIKFIIVLMCISLLFTACTTSKKPKTAGTSVPQTTGDKKLNIESAEKAAEGISEPIQLNFWYSLGGARGDAIKYLAQKFNESQDKYVVNAQYQGSYNESLLKFINSPDEIRPDVIHVNELGTRTIMDTDDYFPIQQFIDDGIIDISDYNQVVLNSYLYKGEMFAWPFSITVPGIIYNVQALEKAGVNPDTDFETFEDLKVASKKIVDSGAAPYGVALGNDAWHIEQLISANNDYFVDADNGHNGIVTKITANETGTLLKVLETIKDFYIQPYNYVGPEGAGLSNDRKEMLAGNVAMIITSVGVLGNVRQEAGGAFDIQIAPLPVISKDNVGYCYPSGAALWVVDRGKSENALGVVEFIKFFMEVEQQLDFVLATGYLPISKAVLDHPKYQKYMTEDNPGIRKVLEDMDKANRGGGAIFGAISQFRQLAQGETTRMALESNYSAEQAVNVIVKEINEAITIYNAANYK